MINLLSKANKKYIKQEYRLRLVALIFKALAIATLAGVLLLIPSYLLTLKRAETFFTRAEVIRNNPDFQAQNTLNELIVQTKKQIDLFRNKDASEVSQRLLVPLLSHVALFSSSITLTGFIYEEPEKKSDDLLINIRGEAATREDLIAFVEDLKKETLFSDVELPVSDLAKKNNVRFSLKLPITKKKLYEE